jgi:hypothetical protein
MNLAFPAVLIVVLLLPGFLSRYWYRKGSWEYPIHVESFAEGVFKGVVSAAVLHALWIWGAHLLGETIDFYAVLVLLTGSSGQELTQALRTATAHPGKVFVYFFSLYLASPLIGWLCHYVVRRCRLDLKLPFLRYDNDWHYVLTGEFLEFPDQQPRRDIEVAFVQVSMVTEVGGDPILVTGKLEEFFFDRAGKLDRLVLSNAYRRQIGKDREAGVEQTALAKDQRFYRIQGNYFVVPYAEVKNLNVGFWTLVKV